MKKRAIEKQLTIDITLDDLKHQWEKQNGICPFSGRKMILATSTSEATNLQLNPDTASLDRIVSNDGYTPNNIQWVCVMAQYGKNIFNSEDFIAFCEDVAQHNRLSESFSKLD